MFRNYLLPLIAVVFGTLLGITFFFGFYESGKNPVIHVDTAEIDFGALSSGTKVTKSVQITNIGQSDLVIEEVVSGCGCTETNLTRNVIPPGRSELLYVTMEPSPFGVKTALLIRTNDPKNQGVFLSVKADSVLTAMVEPTVVDFGLIEDLTQLPISKSIKMVLNPDYFVDTDMSNIVVEANNPFLQIDASQKLTKFSRTIILTLSNESPVGDIFTELYLKEKARTTTIRVLGYVRGNYLALPQMLVLGPIQRQDNPQTQTVSIKFRNPHNIEPVPKLVIESCSLSKSLQGLLTLDMKTEGGQGKIFATINPSLYKGLWSIRNIYGHIEIICSCNAAPTQYLRIPVLVSLKVPKRRDL
ncbi:MAG: DUF1573 domain-containing protein [Prevotellaceae bacterium]|jgi:hypothetical protein|nr:DUF1573 domain-containing protein [Prevotellaceae bacterium]